MEFKTFVGIDVSKNTLDIQFSFIENIQKSTHKVFKNNYKGFNNLILFLKEKKVILAKTLFCLENTGDYSLLLSHFLSKNKFYFHLANPLTVKRSKGLIRAKTDKIDAKMLVIYAYLKREFLERSSLPSLLILKLRNLNTYRKSLIKQKTAHQQYQKLLKQTNELVDNKMILELCQKQIQNITSQIKMVENKIHQIVKTNDSIRENYDLIVSIPGVGPVLAINLLITTRNFTAFDSGRKYASFCGVAPFANTSGTSIKGRTKTSPICNKYIKALLTNSVTSLITHDQGIKQYYKRKKQEGKKHFIIVNNIRAKLINRIFAVIKRKEPYIRLNFS